MNTTTLRRPSWEMPASRRSTSLSCLVACASILLALASPAAFGQCVQAQIQGISNMQRLLTVTGVEVNADDLELSIEGPVGQVIVEWLDENRAVLSSQAVSLGNESTQAVVSAALAGVPQAGFQFYLRLHGIEGGETSFEMPVRIGLDCPAAGTCRWTAELDVYADRPVADSHLLAALADLETAGVADPFGVLLSEQPEWRGELYSLLLQLSGDPMITPSLADDGDSCRCGWVVGISATAGHSQGGLYGQPPLHVSESWYAGDGAWTAQMTAGYHAELIEPQASSAGLRLSCYRVASLRFRQIVLESGRRVAVPLPLAQPCEAPCTATIRHVDSAAICAEARAFSVPNRLISADISLTGAVFVDGSLLQSQTIIAQPSTTSPAGDMRFADHVLGATTTVQANASSSTVRVHGSADLSIGAQSYPAPYIYAAMSADPMIKLSGYATCAARATGELQIGGNTHDGGTMTVRWGDPP